MPNEMDNPQQPRETRPARVNPEVASMDSSYLKVTAMAADIETKGVNGLFARSEDGATND